MQQLLLQNAGKQADIIFLNKKALKSFAYA
jgi:hypothetical protein